MGMVKKVHDHIVEELKANTKTDTVFVLSAITLNLVMLAINTSIADFGAEGTNIILMVLFVGMILVVSFVAEVGLIKGRQTREKLLSGLIRMYKDNKVDGYYDHSLLHAYKIRYTLFMVTVLTTGILAIVVPFIVL